MKRSGLLFRHKPMSEDVVGLCYIKLFSVRIGQDERGKHESIWRKKNFDT